MRDNRRVRCRGGSGGGRGSGRFWQPFAVCDVQFNESDPVVDDHRIVDSDSDWDRDDVAACNASRGHAVRRKLVGFRVDAERDLAPDSIEVGRLGDADPDGYLNDAHAEHDCDRIRHAEPDVDLHAAPDL